MEIFSFPCAIFSRNKETFLGRLLSGSENKPTNAANLFLHIRNLKLRSHFINDHNKKTGANPLSFTHPAASSIFSIKIPYPLVGSFTSTWVTAPTSLPSWMMEDARHE